VVGGVATILHGAPRMTGGLDLAVILQKENLLSLIGAMERLGYKPRAPVNPGDLSDPVVREAWKKDKEMKAFIFTAMPEENRKIWTSLQSIKSE